MAQISMSNYNRWVCRKLSKLFKNYGNNVSAKILSDLSERDEIPMDKFRAIHDLYKQIIILRDILECEE